MSQDIPDSAPAGLISFTQPPQFSTSFFKIAPSQPVTFAWSASGILSTPASLTVKAVGENGFTYPVGPSDDGTIPGDATSVVWDLYSYQKAHPQTPLAVGQYNLQVHDERGMGVGIKGGLLTPNQNLKFGLYTPGAYTAQSSALISFSIEQDRWTDWAGLNERNEFLFNTLDNVVQITGEPPDIRIGANSQDHTNFNKDLETPQLVFPPPTTTVPYPEATQIVVGEAYYKTARFLPPNTHVSWGVNFGQNNLTAAFLQAKSIAEAFASPEITDAGIKLDFIEIGNEGNLFSKIGFRPTNYTVAEYTPEWTEFARNISEVAGITPTSHTKFLAGGFSSSGPADGFTAQTIFDNGILDSEPGSLITTISQHLYSGSFCNGSNALLQDLMTKAFVRSNLTRFAADIAAVNSKGLEYVFGETNSYSCHGSPNVSNTAGAALWTLDYALFARTINITKVFFHEGIGYKYNLIQPATLNRSIIDGSDLPKPLPPHVQPQYYAAIIAAEAIGNSGKTQISEIPIDNIRIAGYGFYEDGKLVRAVFINSQAFSKENGETRPSIHLDFDVTGSDGPTDMTVKRLAIGHAEDTSGLTWGGQSYETPDGRASGEASLETVSVTDGLDLASTEAVLISF
ncbi:hypothetical protein PQX77_001811 [Marasmius sp. AFHP31]|nr:hypothetical protein PQX77_001811 [Marasmius sp. AFHP31]